MRSEKELQSSTYPFHVEFVGTDDICVRNLESGEIVEGTRQTRLYGDDSVAQRESLDKIAVEQANARRRATPGIQAEEVVGETLEQAAARLKAAAA